MIHDDDDDDDGDGIGMAYNFIHTHKRVKQKGDKKYRIFFNFMS